jgi:hypothetical protein
MVVWAAMGKEAGELKLPFRSHVLESFELQSSIHCHLQVEMRT